MPTIDLADFVVVAIVGGGTAYLVGYVTGRHERQQTQRERVQLRRARRLEELDLRHRKPDLDEEQGPDPTVDEPVEGEVLTARGRFSGLAMPYPTLADQVRDAADPVGAIARRRARLHFSTEVSNERAKGILAQLDEGPNVRDAIYGREVRLPLYEAVVADYPTGQYAIVANPDGPVDNPQKPNPGVPAPTKLVGQPRVDASVLHAIWNRQPLTTGGEDEMPVPTTPVPTSGPRPGTSTDTDGRPSQPKPAVLVTR